jgi:hypothetical protein
MAVVSTALAMPLARVMLAETTGRRSAEPMGLPVPQVWSELDG